MLSQYISFDSLLFILHSPIGGLLFIALYALWVTFLLPGIWASMLAGVLYGTWIGSLFVFIGASIGALAGFGLGRTLLRKWVQARLANFPKLQAIEKAVAKEGLKLILLTRLSPAFPFSFLNFMYGLSDVTVKDYTIGLIGILPGTILFCGLGALAGDLSRFREVLDGRTDLNSYIFSFLGLISTLAVIWLVTRTARNALQESEDL